MVSGALHEKKYSPQRSHQFQHPTPLRPLPKLPPYIQTIDLTCCPNEKAPVEAVDAGKANVEACAGLAPKMLPPAAAAVAVEVAPNRVGAAAEVWVPNKPPEAVVGVAPKRGLFAAVEPKRPPVLVGAAANNPPAVAPGCGPFLSWVMKTQKKSLVMLWFIQ